MLVNSGMCGGGTESSNISIAISGLLSVVVLQAHSKKIVDIENSSIEKILNIYPDENLLLRPVFEIALKSGVITYTDLRKECATLLIPWQLFLLQPDKLDKELALITARRHAKFDKKLIASRDNQGRGVSLRIADRLIAFQEFARANISEENQFCGSLCGTQRDTWSSLIMDYFDIEQAKLIDVTKERALTYLMRQLEAKNVRVARGVMNNNKLLPVENNVRSTYRQSSGFAVRDNKVPYIFLPSEVNDQETTGRQILTLLSLLVLIGLNEYNVYVSGDFETRVTSNKTLQRAFGVSSEILLPFTVTDEYRGVQITEEIRDQLSQKYILTPSAIIVTLRQRGLIDDDGEYETLLDIPHAGETSQSIKRTPLINTSVEKFCGTATHNEVIAQLKAHTLSPIDAQYLIFGYIDKVKFATYKANVGL